MNRQQWKELLWVEATSPYRLERLVRRHGEMFDDEDKKVLKLIRCDEWAQVHYGVWQELRSDRGLLCDKKAPAFDPTRRVYHPIRRILMPGTVMAVQKARRNANKVVTL